MTAENFNPMWSAPKDGTTVRLKLRHFNWQFARDDEKAEWEAVVQAKWIDFNGGGWTWNGMCGVPIGWLPLEGKEAA